MLVLILNRNHFLCPFTKAFFPVSHINILVQRINARVIKKCLKCQLRGIISLIKRIDPVHHRAVCALDHSRLKFVIKNLNDIAGFEHSFVNNVERYGKSVVMLEEADIVILIIDFLKHEINKIAYIHISI